MPVSIDIDKFVSALKAAAEDEGYKHDLVGAPGATGYVHGPQGTLSYPGLDPQVFSTYMATMPGLLPTLPQRPTIYGNPLYPIMTGVQDDPSASEPTTVCDEPREGGLQKAGIIRAPFGRYSRRTRELSLERMGEYNDRGEFGDLRIVGDFRTGGFTFAPGDPGNILQNEMTAAVFQRNVSLHRMLTKQAWIGNPANGNGDGYMEMAGLDNLITTGYVDAINGVALPSVDSDVKNFNYAAVQDSAEALIDALSYLARYLRINADRTGVTPVTWTIWMREELFWEISAVWPCAYLKGGCTVQDAAGVTLNIDARDQVEYRDQMRQGRFLDIDGIRYPVRFDSGIVELDGNSSGGNFPAGCFSSDIYFVPSTVMGGIPVTYLETFDFNNSSIDAALATGMFGDSRVVGPWMEHVRKKGGCFEVEAIIRPRIVLRTPWLAGKLENVVYCPLQHSRTEFPTDPYHLNGGSPTRPGPSYYAHWQS